MKTTLDRIIYVLMYILIFVAVICRIEYTAKMVMTWIQVYRISLYAVILLGFLSLFLKRNIEIKGISGFLFIMVLYELGVTVVGYKSLNKTLFNAFMVDTLAWPVIFILTYSLYKDDSIRVPFKVISACGVCIILGITAINLSQMSTMGINPTIGGVAFCVATLPVVYMFFSKKTGIISTIIITILVMISTKRSSFLAVLGGIFAFYISDAMVQQRQRRKINRMLALMLLAIVAAVVGIYLMETSNLAMFQRFASGDDIMSGRTILWQRILRMFSEQSFSAKLFGNGMHAVKYKINPYGLGWYAHNSFIEALYDYGMVGLGMLILFVVFIIKKTITLNKQKSGLAPVLSSTIPPLLFYSSASYFFEVGQAILIYAFVWGLCFAVSEKTMSESEQISIERNK